MTFGEKLKHIRKDILKLSQKELAASIAFSQSTVAALEKENNKQGSFELLKQLVIVHNVNPFYFIYDNGEPEMLNASRGGASTKPLLQKIAKYEKGIKELNRLIAAK